MENTDARNNPLIPESSKPLDQISKEDDIVKTLNMMIGEAEEAAASEIRRANRNWEYLKGNQFLRRSETGDWITDTSNPYWRLRLQRDIIKPIVTTSLAVLHKLRPKMIIEADYPDGPVVAYHNGQHFPLPIQGSMAASQLQDAMESEWDRRSEEILQAELLIDCMVTGNAFRTYMPIYDETGIVRVRPYLLRRDQFLGDPKGSNIATFDDFKYIIIEQHWDVADIERVYGVKERQFAKGNVENPYYAEESGLYRRQYQWKQGSRLGQKYKEMNQARRTYPVHTIFYNQGTPDVIAYGKKAPKGLRYPLGRQMVLINGTKLVADRHNPYWHGRFPITAYQTTPMPHFGGGFSDLDPIIGIQDMVNILQNMVLTNAMVLGVPQWMMEKEAADPGDITNEPGVIIQVEPGALGRGAIERIEPGTIGGDIFNLLRDLQAYGTEDLGDVSEALQGKSLGSNASGVYANTLLGAALTKQGFRGQMIDAGHKRSAWIELMMMQQYMHVDEAYIHRNHDLGELMHMNLAMQELFFDVKVESQAELPHNPSARINMAAGLVEMGIMDIREFLLFTGLKVRPELEQKLNEASEFFLPGVPAQIQAQIRTELEMAKLQMQGAQQGLPGSGQGQRSLPAPSGEGPGITSGSGSGGVAGDPSRQPVL